MSAFYSDKWSSKFGDVFAESGMMGLAWQESLAGVNESQLYRGLDALLAREDVWPPGVAEFRQLCLQPDAVHPDAWESVKPDSAKMPSPERLKWHKENIAWIQAGGELPRPDVAEPAAPAGVMSFWDIYKVPTGT